MKVHKQIEPLELTLFVIILLTQKNSIFIMESYSISVISLIIILSVEFCSSPKM